MTQKQFIKMMEMINNLHEVDKALLSRIKELEFKVYDLRYSVSQLKKGKVYDRPSV